MTRHGSSLRTTVLAGCALAACFAAGCASPKTAGIKVESYRADKITVQSYLVGRRVTVTDIRKDVVNGLLKAEVTAVNNSTADLMFEYRFRWLAANGMEIKTGLATWTSVHAVARDTFAMSGVAPSAEAKEFDFVVRFPDRW